MRPREEIVNTIRAQQAYYIKLGSGGDWEKECIRETQTGRVLLAV